MNIPRPEIKLLDATMGRPVPIVADGGISSQGIMGGRLIPLVILDTSERPEIEECIRVHQACQSPGDARAQWGQIGGKDESVILCLTFIRPSEVLVVIEFAITGQGILVDQALQGKGLYIQAGRPGDRLKHDIQRPKVLVEIGETGYSEIWEAIWTKHLTKEFRTRGLGRSDARRAATAAIQEMRTFGRTLRIRDAVA